jgi:hypothetical protein
MNRLFTKGSVFQHIDDDLVGLRVILYKNHHTVVRGTVTNYEMHHAHHDTKLTINGHTYSGDAFDKIQILDYDNLKNEVLQRVEIESEYAGKHKRSKKSKTKKTKKSKKSKKSRTSKK